jgi:hypothetical protein
MVISKKMRFIGVVILSGLSISTFSCRSIHRAPKLSQNPPGVRGLVETPSVKEYQAPDVPVPANFIHRPQDSYAYITGNVRTIAIRYIGSARTDDLLEFYRKQMSQFGWMEKMTLGVDSKKAIAFQKQNEKCEIEIEQKPSETFLLVKIGYNNK